MNDISAAINTLVEHVAKIVDAKISKNNEWYVNNKFKNWRVSGSQIAQGTISGNHIASRSLSGSNFAPNSITGNEIKDNSVSYLKVQDFVTETAKIAVAEISTATIDTAQITNLETSVADITKATIETADITWADITSLTAAVALIASAEIGSAKIDFGQINSLIAGEALITSFQGNKVHIRDLAVTEANIIDLSVGKLMVAGADGAFYSIVPDGEGGVTTTKTDVTDSNIAEGTVSGNRIVDGSITAKQLNVDDIFADTALIRKITAENIASKTLTADEIESRTITANEIESKTITAEEIASKTITADEIAAHTITADLIDGKTITADEIKTKTITADEIASNTITSDLIKSRTIKGENLEIGAITADEIAADAIVSGKIKAGAIIGTHISTDAITSLNGSLDLSANESIKLVVDGINVGGTNVIPHTDIYISGGHIDNIQGQQFYTQSPVFAQINNDGVSYGELAFGGVVLVPGETYTLSFWAAWWRESGGMRSGELHFAITNAGASIDIYDYQMGFVAADLWGDIPYAGNGYKRYAFTFTIPTAPSTGWQVRFLTFSQSDPTHWYHISDVKMERGNKSTDWSPYPGEMYSGTSVKITPEEGLVVNQYFPGDVSTPFRTQIDSTGLYVKRTSDNVAVMSTGVDSNGNGYVAVNRISDPQAIGNMFFRVFASDGESEAYSGLEMVGVVDGEEYVRGSWMYSEGEVSVNAEGARVRVGGVYGGAGIYGEGMEDYGSFIGRASFGHGGLETYNDGFSISASNVWQQLNNSYPRVIGRTLRRDSEGLAVYSLPELEISCGEGSGLSRIRLTTNPTTGASRIATKGNFMPEVSNENSVGLSTNRYTTIYLQTSPDVLSSRDLKKHIADIQNALAFIKKLKPVMYRLRTESDDNPLHSGLLADDVRDTLQEMGVRWRMLSDSDPDALSLVYEEFVAMLIAATQELASRTEELELRTASLETEVETLKSKISRINDLLGLTEGD